MRSAVAAKLIETAEQQGKGVRAGQSPLCYAFRGKGSEPVGSARFSLGQAVISDQLIEAPDGREQALERLWPRGATIRESQAHQKRARVPRLTQRLTQVKRPLRCSRCGEPMRKVPEYPKLISQRGSDIPLREVPEYPKVLPCRHYLVLEDGRVRYDARQAFRLPRYTIGR